MSHCVQLPLFFLFFFFFLIVGQSSSVFAFGWAKVEQSDHSALQRDSMGSGKTGPLLAVEDGAHAWVAQHLVEYVQPPP